MLTQKQGSKLMRLKIKWTQMYSLTYEENNAVTSGLNIIYYTYIDESSPHVNSDSDVSKTGSKSLSTSVSASLSNLLGLAVLIEH